MGIYERVRVELMMMEMRNGMGMMKGMVKMISILEKSGIGFLSLLVVTVSKCRLTGVWIFRMSWSSSLFVLGKG